MGKSAKKRRNESLAPNKCLLCDGYVSGNKCTDPRCKAEYNIDWMREERKRKKISIVPRSKNNEMRILRGEKAFQRKRKGTLRDPGGSR